MGTKKQTPQPQSPPRRKAGSVAKPKTMRTTTFRIEIEAQEMVVTYEPNWLEGSNGHFEFKSPHEPPRQIILSKSGYFSHFAPMAAVATFASPEEYARVFAQSVLASGLGKKRAAKGGEQLSLF